MTALLKQAFQKASGLSEVDQDSFARFIIMEIDDETKWDRAFESSQSELACMANEALAEYKTGKTKPMDLSSDFWNNPSLPAVFCQITTFCPHLCQAHLPTMEKIAVAFVPTVQDNTPIFAYIFGSYRS